VARNGPWDSYIPPIGRMPNTAACGESCESRLSVNTLFTFKGELSLGNQ
jgi:hypothetical protein